MDVASLQFLFFLGGWFWLVLIHLHNFFGIFSLFFFRRKSPWFVLSNPCFMVSVAQSSHVPIRCVWNPSERRREGMVRGWYISHRCSLYSRCTANEISEDNGFSMALTNSKSVFKKLKRYNRPNEPQELGCWVSTSQRPCLRLSLCWPLWFRSACCCH